MKTVSLVLLTLSLGIPSLVSGIVIDGTVDAEYGPAISVQTHQTAFGDTTNGLTDVAGGSELDNAYAIIESNTLFLALAGNLENNFNKLEIFFDSRLVGGQNRLRGDNPDVDFNGLNRLGDNGATNGLTFDSDFDADYYITMGGGGVVYALFINYADLGSSGVGRFLGSTTAASDGALIGGTNPDGIRVTINNSNTNGVSGGTNAASAFTPVTTGVELAIPLAAIGNPCGTIKIMAAVNAGGHDFLSNQFLGGFDTTNGVSNFGEPRAVNLQNQPGNQYFTTFLGLSNAYSIVGSTAVAGTDQFVVQWTSETGKTYAIYRSTSLKTDFSLLASDIAATAPLNSFTDTVSGVTQQFYHVRATSGCP